jgi:4-diphosphocytidyl-2C-methyl-D-erythritol kinase
MSPSFYMAGAPSQRAGASSCQPLPTLPPFWWVLAKPYEVGVPTGWAYAQLGRGAVSPNARADHTERLARLLPTIRTPRDLAPLLHNDFDTPILQAIPALAELRTLLEQGGALRVILCGSGASASRPLRIRRRTPKPSQMRLSDRITGQFGRGAVDFS